VLPNVGPYIHDVKISGFTWSFLHKHDIGRLRVNLIFKSNLAPHRKHSAPPLESPIGEGC
jgi:hypothetical protein